MLRFAMAASKFLVPSIAVLGISTAAFFCLPCMTGTGAGQAALAHDGDSAPCDVPCEPPCEDDKKAEALAAAAAEDAPCDVPCEPPCEDEKRAKAHAAAEIEEPCPMAAKAAGVELAAAEGEEEPCPCPGKSGKSPEAQLAASAPIESEAVSAVDGSKT
jgi:hypothetical protein